MFLLYVISEIADFHFDHFPFCLNGLKPFFFFEFIIHARKKRLGVSA